MLTRQDRFEEFYMGFVGCRLIGYEMVLPPLGIATADLREWMREMVRRREQIAR